MTPSDFRARKGAGPRLATLTAYDYPTARLLEEAGLDLILVGDSLGMVVLGHPDTTHVTLSDMLHHLRAVVRGAPNSLIVADLPFQTYRTPAEAVANARQLVQAGAAAVKLEGGSSMFPQIAALRAEGIEVMGHLGMLPQNVLAEGGRYTIKGRTEAEADRLIADASGLAEHGVFAIVLELVAPVAAARLTAETPVPTIGIGSGPDCDGQILVTPDLLGAFPWFRPKFVTPKAELGATTRAALAEYVRGIRGES